MEIAIIDRGRGPEIKGTRITVYDILDYTKINWHPNSIALFLGLSTNQVLAAIEYIESHKDEVMAEYEKILERCRRGNSPEVEAKLQESHQKMQAWLKERRTQSQEVSHEGNPSRQ